MRVSSLTSTEKRATLPGKVLIQRRNHHADRVADVNVADVGFRNRNHQTEKIVLGEPHQRHGLRAGTGAGLHQGAQIGEALRDDARKRRGDFRIIEQHLIVLALGLRDGQLALRRSRLDLEASTCASAARSFPWASSTSCCATKPGFDFATPFKRVILQMQHVVLRLDAAEFVLGVRNLVGCVLDGRIVLLQLRLSSGISSTAMTWPAFTRVP